MKTNTFLNDIYRSFICACFPPHVLCAAALFMSALYLKVNLQAKNLKANIRNSLDAGPRESTECASLSGFPWKELFDTDFIAIKRIAELTYEFIKLIKS